MPPDDRLREISKTGAMMRPDFASRIRTTIFKLLSSVGALWMSAMLP
jgi:hypothetical protein